MKFPLFSSATNLRRSQRFSSASGAKPLPVSDGAGNCVVEPKARQDVIPKIFDVHHGSVALSAASAQRRVSRISGLMVKLYA